MLNYTLKVLFDTKFSVKFIVICECNALNENISEMLGDDGNNLKFVKGFTRIIFRLKPKYVRPPPPCTNI